jgi:hypothetical protein
MKPCLPFYRSCLIVLAVGAVLIACARDPMANISAGPASATRQAALPAAASASPAPGLVPSPGEQGAYPASTASIASPASPASSSIQAAPQVFSTTTTPRPTLEPDEWQKLPVLPVLSARALAIVANGLSRGNDPHVFSKVGDCESRTTWFLGDFDAGPKNYALGEHADLQSVIQFYAGSFGRTSLAARPGFNTASVLTSFWADPKLCQRGENSLACEYRRNRPVMAFIMLGTNDVAHPDTFEKNLRQIIEYSLAQDVLPVLATKADNLEGDYSINSKIAALAQEYDLPLWNYWAAVQSLPGKGLQEDKAHLTYAPTNFGDPQAMRRAWPVRNHNALQILPILMQTTQ